MEPLLVIDPVGCACTDCLTGYSVPVNLLTDAQQDLAIDFVEPYVIDRTGLTEREWNEILEAV